MTEPQPAYGTLAEVFAGLDRLADQAKAVGMAFEKHAKAKGLKTNETGLLNRFATILVDYHHAVRHLEAALPKDWRKQQ